MYVIKKLAERIADEIGDACTYAEMASDVRDEHPQLSRTLSEISGQEMNHMSMLQEAVKNLMKQYGEKQG